MIGRYARSAVRAHRSSLVGACVVIVLATTLLTATLAWVEAGIRARMDGIIGAGLLTTVTSSFAGTAMLIIVLIVASTLTAALGQREREFALLRAIGATKAQVRRIITAEVLLLFAVAAPLGAVPGLLSAHAMTPLLAANGLVPAGFALGWSVLPVVAAAAVLFPTGFIAGRIAARKMTALSPSDAVRHSTADLSPIGRIRRGAAIGIAAVGLGASASPFIVPGTVGSATGSVSAILLVIAAACAGPALISTAARYAMRTIRSTRLGPIVLAFANARGFSRRLTTAIIPLALLLSLGTVQGGLNQAMNTAARDQLANGITADIVAQPTPQADPKSRTQIAAIPGVTGLTTTAVMSAEVKIDHDDDMPALMDGLLWEPAPLRILHADQGTTLLDPQVHSGSLEQLAASGTVAVSDDALFGSGNKLGGSVDVRLPGGGTASLRIVAVYERGLGLGDYLIGAQTLGAHTRLSTADTMLIATSPGAGPHVRDELVELGLAPMETAEFIDQASSSGSSEQDLSTILLWVLLAFVGLASVNTLAMITGSRRAEFALLTRTGATRRQIMVMVIIETLLIIGAATVIGWLTVLPTLLSVGIGLTGNISSAFAIDTVAAVTLTVIMIAFGAVTGTAYWITRPARKSRSVYNASRSPTAIR